MTMINGLFETELDMYFALLNPQKSRDAVFCEHANESPSYCPCDSHCYCRIEGNCELVYGI